MKIATLKTVAAWRMRRHRIRERSMLAAHLNGELPARKSALIRQRTASEPALRREMDGLVELQGRLRTANDSLPRIDVRLGVQQTLQQAPAPSRNVTPSSPWSQRRLADRLAGARCIANPTTLVAVGVVIAAVVLLPLRARHAEKWEVDALREKGRSWKREPREGHRKAVSAIPAAELQLYVVRNGKPSGNIEAIVEGDGLMVSYINAGSSSYRFLMVFALMPGPKVYWYHPAYEDRESDPQSIPIKPSSHRILLREVITHGFAPGKATIVGLFSHRPMAVSEVESWIEEHGGLPDEELRAGVHRWVSSLEVRSSPSVP